MTTIHCANSSGKVLVEDDGYLCWFLNDDDGLGADVWHLAVPRALVRDLGANVAALIDALGNLGMGFQVAGANDRDQQLAQARAADNEFTRWTRGGL